MPEVLWKTRRRRRLTQARVAIELGVYDQTYVQWERGAATPRFTFLVTMLRWLDEEVHAPAIAALSDLPAVLRTTCRHRGLRLTPAADAIHVSHRLWDGWEREEAKPSFRHALAIMRWLGGEEVADPQPQPSGVISRAVLLAHLDQRRRLALMEGRDEAAREVTAIIAQVT